MMDWCFKKSFRSTNRTKEKTIAKVFKGRGLGITIQANIRLVNFLNLQRNYNLRNIIIYTLPTGHSFEVKHKPYIVTSSYILEHS